MLYMSCHLSLPALTCSSLINYLTGLSQGLWVLECEKSSVFGPWEQESPAQPCSLGQSCPELTLDAVSPQSGTQSRVLRAAGWEVCAPCKTGQIFGSCTKTKHNSFSIMALQAHLWHVIWINPSHHRHDRTILSHKPIWKGIHVK